MRFLLKMLPRRFNPLHWRKLAYRDTHGLRNRAWLFDTAALLYEQKKKSWDFLLLYVDLRNFRSVNNKYSHAEGNKVLKSFYNLLESKFRTHQPTALFTKDRKCHEKDILVVREGGDEFVVFLPLGVCAPSDRERAINVINGRINSLSIKHRGILVTARVAVVASQPDNPFESFLDYFHKADRKLSLMHKNESRTISATGVDGRQKLVA